MGDLPAITALDDYKPGTITRVLARDGSVIGEFSAERLKDAVAATSKGQPLDLLVRTGDMYRTFRVDYRDGLKYPHLERIAGTQDRLIAILSARK